MVSFDSPKDRARGIHQGGTPNEVFILMPRLKAEEHEIRPAANETRVQKIQNEYGQ
jgi:hypothetical protein